MPITVVVGYYVTVTVDFPGFSCGYHVPHLTRCILTHIARSALYLPHIYRCSSSTLLYACTRLTFLGGCRALRITALADGTARYTPGPVYYGPLRATFD